MDSQVPEPMGEPTAPAERLPIRASDAEREAVVERLRVATAEGRLTLEELTDRSAAAYTATTRADLDLVVADLPLPAGGPARAPAPAQAPSRPVVAVFGSAERHGRWRADETTDALAVFGSVELDLRETQIPQPEVDIRARAVFGSVEIIVPEGVDVDLTGPAIFGNRSAARIRPAGPGAPVVRVRALAVLGSVEVRHHRDEE